MSHLPLLLQTLSLLRGVSVKLRSYRYANVSKIDWDTQYNYNTSSVIVELKLFFLHPILQGVSVKVRNDKKANIS